MQATKYIHYGCKEFDPARFQPIKNIPLHVKPGGGLWASRTDSDYGWKQWCDDNEFRECRDDNSFCFTLSPSANVLRIRTASDLENLPTAPSFLGVEKLSWRILDFEKLLNDGVDAIELFINGELYFMLYGWDCDSILVMNKDVIEYKTSDKIL